MVLEMHLGTLNIYFHISSGINVSSVKINFEFIQS